MVLLFSRFQKNSVALFNLSRFDGRIDGKDGKLIVGLEPEPMCPSCQGDASMPVNLCVVSLFSCFACWTCVKCRINKCLRHIFGGGPDMEGALAAGDGTRAPEAPNPGVHSPHKRTKQPGSCRNSTRLTANPSSPAHRWAAIPSHPGPPAPGTANRTS